MLGHRGFTFCLLLFASAASPVLGQPAGSQGLDDKDRATWYHLSQGTEIFPYQFLRALKDADSGNLFMKNLERFGFLSDPVGPANPFGVPVGMSVETTRDLRRTGVKMIGLNCAACHTAQMELQGLPVLRADGGTNMFDANAFSDALAKSTLKTIENPVELVHFMGRLLRQSVEDQLNLKQEGLLINPLSKNISAGLNGILDSVEGQDKLIGDHLRDLIRDELKKTPLDLSQGIITNPQDPKLKEFAEKLRSPVAKLELLFPARTDLFKPTRLFSLVPADQKREVTSSLQDIITTLRLLRARLAVLQSGSSPIRTTAGFGRVDAFGAARNKLFPKTPISLDAPIRYPFLWTLKDQLTWYHWDGNTDSRKERNTGEAIGVGVVVDPVTFESTLRFDNLMNLEKIAMKLEAPKWPDTFGKIDREKAARGEAHFKNLCAACHMGSTGDKVDPLTHLNTDSLRVRNIRMPVGDQGFFDAISPILKQTIVKAGGTPDGTENHWRPSKDNAPNLALGYTNRPLPAVWASPPYLHNGSVPSLYQLLLPAEKRLKEFPTGHREYDPQHLGYSLNPARPRFTFDTRQSGNSNSGHSGAEYGTALSDEQRFELIEYLKSK